MKISPLQMTDASSWKGLTTENHLGALWQQSPQKVSNIITKIQQKSFGDDLEALLSKYPTQEFESDLDYTWDLESQAIVSCIRPILLILYRLGTIIGLPSLSSSLP